MGPMGRIHLRDVTRPRLLAHAIFFLLLWPVLSLPAGVIMLREQPITGVVAPLSALAGLAAGAVAMAPELLVTGAIAALFGILVFALFLRPARGAGERERATWIEPFALLLAMAAGFAIEYPALLHHPLFLPLRGLTVSIAQIALPLLAVLCGLLKGTRRAALGHLAAIAVAMLVSWGVTRLPAPSEASSAPGDSIFLLGLDSLSQDDPLGPLRQTVSSIGGTWYEHPVTPGLLTNSVWTAILQHRRVHETGVFLTYQAPDWNRSPYQMVREAKRNGFETWSFFSDQFTTYVGSVSSFDVDRSGPKGWLQVATATMKDAQILAPVLLPHLPRVPFARTPRNQSGTFAFSLETELRDFFTAGSGRRNVLAMAHVDYLHQPAYPSMSELSPDERMRVRGARVGAIRDLSLHWQYPLVEGEPLGIYAWKIANLQRVTNRVIAETAVTDPSRRNRIVIFSDHGNRADVTTTEFARRRYYKVILATSGIAPRDPRRPISLLDIADLIGLPDASRRGPADLVVEYTNVAGDSEWEVMLRTAKLSADGEVLLDPRVSTILGRRLLAYWPHQAQKQYLPVPTIPAEVTRAGGR